MEDRLFSLLEDGVKQIDNCLCTQEILNNLKKYYDTIKLYNPSLKLVSADDQLIVTRHILDCLAPYPIIKQYIKCDSQIADLGSGSGLPGVVLACAFNNVNFYLIERMGRRAGFLRNTCALLKLNDRVFVEEKDLTQLKTIYEVITFRAFRHMKDIASDLLNITKKGSVVFAYKSDEDDINQEINDLKTITDDIFSWNIVPYQVPYLQSKRNMLILTRNS